MTTIQSSIELNDEQLSALDGTIAELNARRPDGSPEWTRASFLSDQNKAYVYQFFPAVHNERVKYQDHYEMITLVKKQGKWKVQKLIYSK